MSRPVHLMSTRYASFQMRELVQTHGQLPLYTSLKRLQADPTFRNPYVKPWPMSDEVMRVFDDGTHRIGFALRFIWHIDAFRVDIHAVEMKPGSHERGM